MIPDILNYTILQGSATYVEKEVKRLLELGWMVYGLPSLSGPCDINGTFQGCYSSQTMIYLAPEKFNIKAPLQS